MTKINPPAAFGPYFAESPDAPWNYHLFVVVLPLDVIDRLTMAARHYAAQVRPNPLDNRGDNMNYPVVPREAFAFIRHCLINRTRIDATPRDYPMSYDNLLFRIAQNGVDVEARRLDLKLAVARLIAEHYPHLKAEAEYYSWIVKGKPNAGT